MKGAFIHIKRSLSNVYKWDVMAYIGKFEKDADDGDTWFRGKVQKMIEGLVTEKAPSSRELMLN